MLINLPGSTEGYLALQCGVYVSTPVSVFSLSLKKWNVLCVHPAPTFIFI